MTTTYSNGIPDVTCPECDHNWIVEDYYNLDNGSVLECPNCGVEITLSEKEEYVKFTFTTEEKLK